MEWIGLVVFQDNIFQDVFPLIIYHGKHFTSQLCMHAPFTSIIKTKGYEKFFPLQCVKHIHNSSSVLFYFLNCLYALN